MRKPISPAVGDQNQSGGRLASQEISSRLKAELPCILEDTPIRVVYLFGSVVRDQMLPGSDVDLAILLGPENRMSPYDRMMLELELAGRIESACGFREVDVRGLDLAPLPFQGIVLTQGKLVYSCDEGLRVDFEVQTRSMYFDFLPVIQQMQDALIQRITHEGLIRYGS